MARRRAGLVQDLRLLHDALATTALAGRYAVCGGMLLGWAREQRLLCDDLHDVDFVVRAGDVPAFLAAVPALVSAGFVPRACYRNNDGDPAEFRFMRHGTRFEFFVIWDIGDRTRYYMYDKADELVCERLRQPDAPFEFLGRCWLKPADHDRALSDNYGDWRGPATDWDFTQARTVLTRRPARFGLEEWNGSLQPPPS